MYHGKTKSFYCCQKYTKNVFTILHSLHFKYFIMAVTKSRAAPPHRKRITPLSATFYGCMLNLMQIDFYTRYRRSKLGNYRELDSGQRSVIFGVAFARFHLTSPFFPWATALPNFSTAVWRRFPAHFYIGVP